jgi:hypothetical protein
VTRQISKLLLLIAVLLMPFGMATAPAAAAENHGTSMPMQHCPEPGSKQSGKSMVAECTMACAAALPAMDHAAAEAPRILCLPAQPAVAQRLNGLHPDIATPPPKAS